MSRIMYTLLAAMVSMVSSTALGQTALDPSTVKATVTTSSGDPNLIQDFQIVSVPQSILGATKLDHRSLNLFCSKRWPGVIASVSGEFFSMNDRAKKDLANGGLLFSGKPVEANEFDSLKSPFAADLASTKIVADRAMRHCGHEVQGATPPVAQNKRVGGSTDSLDSAYKICMVVDDADIASKPCEVSAWNRAIQITLDVRSAEAKAICRKLADASKERSWLFTKGWKIEMLSPYSNGNSIAYCNL